MARRTDSGKNQEGFVRWNDFSDKEGNSLPKSSGMASRGGNVESHIQREKKKSRMPSSTHYVTPDLEPSVVRRREPTNIVIDNVEDEIEEGDVGGTASDTPSYRGPGIGGNFNCSLDDETSDGDGLMTLISP